MNDKNINSQSESTWL